MDRMDDPEDQLETEEMEYGDLDITSTSGSGSKSSSDLSTSANNSDSSSRVRKLDNDTSSKMRKGQIITKVSDVVRELVDNSLDSQASSIQVLMENFGVDKIEVRDNGQGIPSSQFVNAVAGGYTSKLANPNHTSCHDHYGFRGEALSSICSVAQVCVTTKTKEDLKAIKYDLDNSGQVVSESEVAHLIGTTVEVQKVFINFPVRRQWVQDKTRCNSELKEIETYLKSVSIANPRVHISLRHNSSLIWNKPSVTNIDQALIACLGHGISKNLGRCGPCNIEVGEVADDGLKQRTIEAFFLKKPIDMKTMSFTSNKMMMIFVNRKRVHIRQFEKLIQQYTAAAIEKPAPADRRRFPVSLVHIQVPFDEVDFNRNMDKSKVFLVHREAIYDQLETTLKKFYGITSLDAVIEDISTCPHFNENQNLPSTMIEDNMNRGEHGIQQPVFCSNKSCHDQDMAELNSRAKNIQSFFEHIPSASPSNFAQSPSKSTTESVSNNFPPRSPVSINQTFSISLIDPENMAIDSGDSSIRITTSAAELHATTPMVNQPFKSNFELNLEEIMGSPPESIAVEIHQPEQQVPKPRAFDMNDWLGGRIQDPQGNIIQSVKVINADQPRQVQLETTSTPERESIHEMPMRTSLNAFDLVGSRFRQTSLAEEIDFRVPKRPRLIEMDTNSQFRPRSESSLSTLCTPRTPTPKKVTIDSYYNWETPGKRHTPLPPMLGTPTGIRLSQPILNSPSPTGMRPSQSMLGTPSPTGVRLSQPSPRGVRLPLSTSSMHSAPIATRSNRLSVEVGMGSCRTNCDTYGTKSNISLGQTNSSNFPSMFTNSNSSLTVDGCKLIGPASDHSLFMVKVNDSIGIFHPLHMLQHYPSLKYDLNISLVKTKINAMTDETNSEYIVAEDCVPKLFNEFIKLVDLAWDKSPKIFHPLLNVNAIQGNWLRSYS